MGEKGPMTDQDLQRARGMLPQVTDTRKVAKQKLNNIRRFVDEKSKTTSYQVEVPKYEEKKSKFQIMSVE
jgi:hypothetical protein